MQKSRVVEYSQSIYIPEEIYIESPYSWKTRLQIDTLNKTYTPRNGIPMVGSLAAEVLGTPPQNISGYCQGY